MSMKSSGDLSDLAVVGMEACLNAHFVSRTMRILGSSQGPSQQSM